MVYKWKDGAHVPKVVDAQRIGSHLERLRAREEHLTPERVVEDAKQKRAPTHTYFEWDDGIAAAGYRLNQARQLLRSLVVEIDRPGDTPTITRAFVVVNEEEQETVYTSTLVAMREPVLRAQVLKRALDELKAWQRKYEELEELADLIQAIDRVASQPELAPA